VFRISRARISRRSLSRTDSAKISSADNFDQGQDANQAGDLSNIWGTSAHPRKYILLTLIPKGYFNKGIFKKNLGGRLRLKQTIPRLVD